MPILIQSAAENLWSSIFAPVPFIWGFCLSLRNPLFPANSGKNKNYGHIQNGSKIKQKHKLLLRDPMWAILRCHECSLKVAQKVWPFPC